MTGAIAALPMYDWPAARRANDRLWGAVRDRLRAAGVAAPERLSRDVGLVEGWRHPGLVLGQTCGLPLVGALAGRVTVVGAGDYRLPGCQPGWYRSAVVARADDGRTALAEFRGAVLAVNGFDSQSGWGSVRHHVAPLAREGRFFAAVTVTGAHVDSVEAVAAGRADLAAIDMVTWRHCLRHRPAARRLRVVLLTEPTPGLPYIAAPGAGAGPLAAALAAAIDGLAAADREELGLARFVPMAAADWGVVAGRQTAAAGLRW